MRTAPEDLDERDLAGRLAYGWGVRLVRAEYVPIGGGSHHWRVEDDGGGRHWVTVDDLDRKPFLGASREASFDGLRRALETAGALRRSGLEFVVAPVPSSGGEVVLRLGARYAVALYPFLEGRAFQFGELLPAAEHGEVGGMLARLHRATPAVIGVARPAGPLLPERDGLEQALGDLGSAWAGGPFSEAARALLVRHGPGIRRLLAAFDRLVDEVTARSPDPVLTHGEPHPGNLIGAGGRLHLVDWDTAALAPPERDLWLLDGGSGEGLLRYAEASRRQPSRAALRLYRLRWQLDDIAVFLKVLRSSHRRTADTEHAWRSLQRSMPAGDD